MRGSERSYIPWQEALAQGSNARFEQIERVKQAEISPIENLSKITRDSFWERYRNPLATTAAILGVPLGLNLVSACSQPPAIVREATPTPTPSQESKLEQIKTPLFSDDNFSSIIKGLKNNEYAVTFTFLKDPSKQSPPPFYNYPQTFEYTTYYFQRSPVAQEFKELGFINLFLPYGSIPQGARTYKAGGQIAAEARLLMNQKSRGIEIEEVHYGPDGRPIFRSKSQFDENLNKIGQTEEIGTKQEEYYFIWPMVHE